MGQEEPGIDICAMLEHPNSSVLVAECSRHRIHTIDALLEHMSRLAGDTPGHKDGAVGQALFNEPSDLALLSDDRVLVADAGNHRIRLISADLQEVSTVAGDGEDEHRDGAAAQAQFSHPRGLALLPDKRVLVADTGNNCIRLISADLTTVATVAGGMEGHQDGAAAQAQFNSPTGLAVLPGGQVLVADEDNHRIRMLSADLQTVFTVAGDGGEGDLDGPADQARFNEPTSLLVLKSDGVVGRNRVLVADKDESDGEHAHIRLLIFNPVTPTNPALNQVITGTIPGDGGTQAFTRLRDGHVLVTDGEQIHKLKGLADLMGPKRAAAPVARGSSFGPARKRNRSEAGPSNAAAASSDSEDEQGGSAAAEPLLLFPNLGRLRF